MTSTRLFRRSAFALAAILLGCSASPSDGAATRPIGEEGGQSGADGQAGGGSGYLNVGDASDSDGQPLSPDAACAASTVQSSLMPLAIYVLLDRSGSMKQNNKWQDASTAFQQFLVDPSASGIKVALSFFPSAGGTCDGMGYATPVVPMAALPGNAGPLNNAIQANQPGSSSGSGGTPMEGALRGLSIFCGLYAPNNPGEKTVGVLITDGLPNGCNENTSALAAIAAGMNGATPPAPLFTIGMQGADFAMLNQLAAAGGSQQSFDVSQGGAQAFLAALQAIAGQALPCELALPTNQSQQVDPAKVNVKYTGQNGTEQFLGQVANAAACVPNAWYYDDPQQPTKIVLCPDTCAAVRSDAAGTIDIILGCGTVVASPS